MEDACVIVTLGKGRACGRVGLFLLRFCYYLLEEMSLRLSVY